MEIPKYKCKRCKYEWNARISRKPKACPNCKRYDWDSPSGPKAKSAKANKSK